ncbi:MAG TPA: FAD-dependent oxidoreductase [Longimicrobiaceae bacterium]|nr:FAD-dependent oxidoreductase [Longimicrobiaceae bacterium]
MRVAVLGGGIAGLMVARELADAPENEIDVLERDSRVGGLLRSVTAGGLEFDIGAFAFGHHHELLRGYPALAERMVAVHARQQAYTPAGSLDGYPLTLRGFVRDNGVLRTAVAGADLFWGRIRYRRRDTVPAFASFYMGASLYRLSGLPDYMERLWGVPHDQLALQLNEQTLVRIRDYTLLKLLAAKVRTMTGAAGPRTMLVRPPEGFDAVWDVVAHDLAARGVSIRTGTEVQGVRRTDDGFEVRVDGAAREYDAVVSTIPLPLMLRLLGETPAARFESASMLSLFYRGRMRPEAPFVYNFSRRGRWKRITNFARFYAPEDGMDWFTVEITTRDTTPAALAELRDEFEAHARDLGMLDGLPELLGQQVTERAYPVFRVGDPARVEAERRRVAAMGVALAGRQGRFEYQSSALAAVQARSVGRGLRAVDTPRAGAGA